jgi:hypothetical protein
MTEKVFSPGEVLTAADVNDYLLNKTGSGNEIINGAFEINQRGFTSASPTGFTFAFGFDRWRVTGNDGTVTYSSQAFTPGLAPLPGYESSNHARVLTSGQTLSSAVAQLGQPIEGVRTFANQEVTVSFWAKAASGTPKIAIELAQVFGDGGSTRVSTVAGQTTLSTSWARYSLSVLVPSISGKTIGTNSSLGVNLWVSAGSDFNDRTGSLGIQSNTFDIWGVQVEAGSVATEFKRNANSLQGELAACQRYYYQWTPNASGEIAGVGFAETSTSALVFVQFPVTLRADPTGLVQSGTAADYSVRFGGGGIVNCSAVPSFNTGHQQGANIVLTVASGLTLGQAVQSRAASTNGFLAWSAEL